MYEEFGSSKFKYMEWKFEYIEYKFEYMEWKFEYMEWKFECIYILNILICRLY